MGEPPGTVKSVRTAVNIEGLRISMAFGKDNPSLIQIMADRDLG